MIRQISTAAFAFFTVFSLWSCDQSVKEEAFPYKVYPELLGQYELVKSYSSWNGKITLTKIESFETISINIDGTFQVYRDGKSISRRKYYMGKKAASIGQSDSVYVMSLAYEAPNCEDIRTLLQLRNDTLFTRSIWSGDIDKPNNSMTTCADCACSVFVRQRPATNPTEK